MPHHREAATVLHQLLDDVPMAALINGYGWTRELGDDFDLPAESSDRLRDRCAGWINDGVMLGALDETGHLPDPARARRARPRRSGRPAGLARDGADGRRGRSAAGAASTSSTATRSRSTCTSATATSPSTPPRTSSTSTRSRRRSIPTTLVVLSSEAQARTLPWPECPNALASAGRIAGEPVADLRAKVHADFRGTTTCTHLNDVLRSLAGVSALARGR